GVRRAEPRYHAADGDTSRRLFAAPHAHVKIGESAAIGTCLCLPQTLARWSVLILELALTFDRQTHQRLDDELADGHPRVEGEGRLGMAQDLERDRTLEPSMNRRSREVHHDAEPSERTAAFDSSSEERLAVSTIVEIV